MKKILTGFLSLSFIASGAYLTGCSCFDNGDPPGNPPVSEATGYVSLEINPSIELIVDQYGKVMNVNAANDDARVLLYNETGIIGATVEEAVKKITRLANNLGYLTNNDIVGILSEGIAQEKITAITSAIAATAQSLGLSITTDLEGGYSLQRELGEFKDKYPNNTNIQELTLSKFKLALAVCETSNMNLEVAIELADDELIDRLNSNISKIELYMTEGFQKARDIAQSTFEQSKLFASDISYIYWFSQNGTGNLSDSYLGAMYVLYHATGMGLDLIVNTIENNLHIKDYVISQDQINSIVDSLGLTDANVLKDSSGNVTIKRVEKYLDVYAKENPTADINTIKNNVDTILDQAEIDANNALIVARDLYLAQIRSIFEKTQLSLTSLDSIYTTLNSNDDTKDAANDITTRIETYNAMITTLKNFVDNVDSILSLSELKTIRDNLLDVADELKDDIDAVLTSDQKSQIEVIKTTSLTQLTASQVALAEALNAAEIAAKTALIRLKLEKQAE